MEGPKKPGTFRNVEFDDCTFLESVFTGVDLIGCDVRGMKIDGVHVTELINAYGGTIGEKRKSYLARVLSKWMKRYEQATTKNLLRNTPQRPH